MPHGGVDSNDARCDTYWVSHGGAFMEKVMEKAKDMYQRKVRFPEDVRIAIERNGEEQCRQFNTELIYQLRKAYGLTGEKIAQA